MALPHTFAALSTAQMSFLDDNDQALGALTTIQATASGTNAITLTPAANAPSIAAYGLPNPVRFGFQAPATSTGAVTLRLNALTFLKVFTPSGVQATTGDLSSNSYYEVVYLASLDTGAGGFLIVSAVPGTGTAPVAIGSTKGLSVTNNAGTPSTKIDITANKATLVTTTGAPIFLSSVSVTIDLTTTGAGGMDTGGRPASGWVYCYLISNGTLTNGIATTTAPGAGSFSPVPSGYIYSTYVGAMFCDGSQNLRRTKQFGRVAHYSLVAASNTPSLPGIANGLANTYSGTSPTLGTASITGVVPATASKIGMIVTSCFAGNTPAGAQVAPNTGWGGTNNGPAGSVGNTYPGWVNNTIGSYSMSTWMDLDNTSTVAWASGGAGGAITCFGWEDYYVN